MNFTSLPCVPCHHSALNLIQRPATMSWSLSDLHETFSTAPKPVSISCVTEEIQININASWLKFSRIHVFPNLPHKNPRKINKILIPQQWMLLTTKNLCSEKCSMWLHILLLWLSAYYILIQQSWSQ